MKASWKSDGATVPEQTQDGRKASWRELRLVVFGLGAPQTFAVKRGVNVVGRGADADISINAPSLSRRHARLFFSDRLQIEDLGSVNGTYVRGSKLAVGKLADLFCGEAIGLGKRLVGLLLGVLPAVVSDENGESHGVDAALIARVAKSDISVVLNGETGVGKEVTARHLHADSPRAAEPFVVIHCGAVAENLLESELFGYQKGAFTGAAQSKMGLFEAAHGGTVFLDEVGEMPPALQVKLLRVLEQREVLPVGATTPRPINVRIIAATHRDLESEVTAGRFRQDLFFRLAGITLTIAPLRERVSEIVPLARTFIEEAAKREGFPAPSLSEAAVAALESHPWPGNIRELKNVIARAVLLADAGVINPAVLALRVEKDNRKDSLKPHPGAQLKDAVRELERQRILDALEQAAGNQTRAAKILGIARGTLIARMEEYGIPRPRK